MVRDDPPCYVLIDMGGTAGESIYPLSLGYGALGKGGDLHRPPHEECDMPRRTSRGDYYRLYSRPQVLARRFYRTICGPHADATCPNRTHTVGLGVGGQCGTASMAEVCLSGRGRQLVRFSQGIGAGHYTIRSRTLVSSVLTSATSPQGAGTEYSFSDVCPRQQARAGEASCHHVPAVQADLLR